MKCSLLGLLKRGDSSFLEDVGKYSLLDCDRLENLEAVCRRLNKEGVTGDFVECGTCKGGSAVVLGKGMGEGRHLWLYDSFQGLPPATDKDGLEALKLGTGACYAPVAAVKSLLNKYNIEPQNFSIMEGWFSDTFKKKLPSKVALLHCDADWYESVLLVLRTFYPIISEGGCVVLDDFGYWEGCREAFYDFCKETGEKPLLERCGITQAFWFKGKSFNR